MGIIVVVVIIWDPIFVHPKEVDNSRGNGIIQRWKRIGKRIKGWNILNLTFLDYCVSTWMPRQCSSNNMISPFDVMKCRVKSLMNKLQQ